MRISKRNPAEHRRGVRAAGFDPTRLLSVEVAEDPPWNSNKGSKESGDIFYIRQVKMRV